MSQAYKKTMTKLFWSINFGLILFMMSACGSEKVRENTRLTERDVTYQKGLALFNASKYAESAPFFLKLSQSSVEQYDEIYNSSLWNLSLIYEKFGEFDKAVFALQELERRHSPTISVFKIQLSLMKNYIRLDNKLMALEIRKKVDATIPVNSYPLSEIYFSIADNTFFNYDISMIEELKFLGEIEKYFIFVMESKNSSFNSRATDLLIGLYDGFFKAFNNDAFNDKFKRTLSIELLEQLRRFDNYKLNDLNLNPKTISKFSSYSVDKQKILTDWLHR